VFDCYNHQVPKSLIEGSLELMGFFGQFGKTPAINPGDNVHAWQNASVLMRFVNTHF
jgi:hypothetical protein